MAQRVEVFHVTTPAGGTVQTALIFTQPGWVDRLEIIVPPGPLGKLAFSIGQAGTQIIPEVAGESIVTNDEKISWQLDGFLNTGSWLFFGTNTGIYDHAVELRFLVSDVDAFAGQAQLAAPGPLPLLVGLPFALPPVINTGVGA